MNIKDRFWLKDPALLGDTLRSYLALNPALGELREIGRSFSDRPICALRYGSGPQSAVFVNAVHGWEVLTTNSAVSVAWSLFAGRDLFERDISALTAEIARKQTVWILPLCSPDIAARQYRRFPEGFFPNGVGTKTREDRLHYAHVMNDPYEYYTGQLVAGYFHGFAREQVDAWLEDHEYLGQRWSDQGLDVWVDFEQFASPEGRALRDFLLQIRPDCLMEYHGHEAATFLTGATPGASPAKAARQDRFAREMSDALVATGIKCAVEPVNVYLKPNTPTFMNWVEKQWPESMLLFSELEMYMNEWDNQQRPRGPAFAPTVTRPMATQEELIRSGWTYSMKLLEIGNREMYRTAG